MDKLAKYLSGSVHFSIIGGRGEQFLNSCAAEGIAIQNIQATPTGFTATVPLRNYCALHTKARKQRCKLRVEEKYGAYFALRVYRSRKGLLIGAGLFVLLFWLLQNLVWSIVFYDFTGDEQRFLRAQLYEKGIYEGCFYDKDTVAKIESELFVQNNVYGWIQMNFKRGRMEIEKTDVSDPTPFFDTTVTDVRAVSDAVVQRVELEGGFLSVTPGQAVVEGDLLVSGMYIGTTQIPYYTRADAKVYATLEKTCQVTQPYTVDTVEWTSKAKPHYALWMFGKKITLYKDLPTQNVQTQVFRYPLKVLGFALPVTVEETRVRTYRPVKVTYTEAEALSLARVKVYDLLSTVFEEYDVLAREEEVTQEGENLILRTKLTIEANIAKVVPFSQVIPEKTEENAQDEIA